MQNKKIEFKYIDGLLIINAFLEGKIGKRSLRCAIDTACAITTVRTDIIDSLGYSMRDADRLSYAISSSGKERGYILRVKCFSFDNIKLNDLPVDVIDLPEDVGIDCLLGNDILDKFFVKINYKKQILYLDNY